MRRAGATLAEKKTKKKAVSGALLFPTEVDLMEEVVVGLVVVGGGGDLSQLNCWQTATQPHLDLAVKEKNGMKTNYPSQNPLLHSSSCRPRPEKRVLATATPRLRAGTRRAVSCSVRCPPSTALPAIWRCGNRAAEQPGGEAGEEAENTKRPALFGGGGGRRRSHCNLQATPPHHHHQPHHPAAAR